MAHQFATPVELNELANGCFWKFKETLSVLMLAPDHLRSALSLNGENNTLGSIYSPPVIICQEKIYFLLCYELG